ncbi:hypothetical protein STAFG_5953 [Streptomyces afghaniensis 772]|uniref:Uncharacterized protein n=1 Tax=Streptomyces afghaniensis 772 TaxID=1283301 RepID=S4MTP4_9ACTN|nr:hypothetical protein STAFG_5953 [Streptomyces afghaniensis 772]
MTDEARTFISACAGVTLTTGRPCVRHPGARA